MLAAAAGQETEGEQQAAGHDGGRGRQLRFCPQLLRQGAQFIPQFLPQGAQLCRWFGLRGLRFSLPFWPQGVQFGLQPLPVSFPVWFALHHDEYGCGAVAVAHLTRKPCRSGRAAVGQGGFCGVSAGCRAAFSGSLPLAAGTLLQYNHLRATYNNIIIHRRVKPLHRSPQLPPAAAHLRVWLKCRLFFR